MQIRTTVFWLPKAGNQTSEYEDAHWPVRGGPARLRAHGLRAAVADGATESSFSGLWARLLAQAAGRGELATLWEPAAGPAGLAAQLQPLQTTWLAEVRRRPLPWYAEAKVQHGAFAALLGVELLPPASHPAAAPEGEQTPAAEPVYWRAFALGDCCLVHVRAGGLLASFPATDASFFTQSPLLIGSSPGRNGTLHDALRVTTGTAFPGDVLCLMTDALAHWALAHQGADPSPWVALTAHHHTPSRRGFAAWIHGLRAAGQLRNDDVTLVCLALAPAGG